MTSMALTPKALYTVVTESVRLVATELVRQLGDDEVDSGPHAVPRDLRLWLAGLRLLAGVPFGHLVADSALLPPESIRFFYVDRGWTDSLVEGALSVGTVTTADRSALAALYTTVRGEVDEAERLVRLPGVDPGAAVPSGPAGTISGFLLRSRLVSGWPGLHVRGYAVDNRAQNPPVNDEDVDGSQDVTLDRLGLLRMERLAPAVLLVLFDGVPAVVHLEEPRAGIQFGVVTASAQGSVGATVSTRNPVTGKPTGTSVPVPFRSGSPGVIHLGALSRKLIKDDPALGPTLDAAEFALQMLQFPYRAVFGDRSLAGGQPSDPGSLFLPTISITALLHRFEGGLMVAYDPQQVAAVQTTARFSVLARGRLDLATLSTWDGGLLREPRVLVPVDVQAYVVPPSGGEPVVLLPGPLSPGAPTDASVVDGPAAFSSGTARPVGVHLSWAMPDSLQRGRVQDPRHSTGGGLGMVALPDRWAVLRLVAATKIGDAAAPVLVRGWLIDAAAGTVRNLDAGPAGAPLPQGATRALAPGELTGTAGGSLTWTGTYDAAYPRFAWHDPLDDLIASPELGGALPGGPAAGAATYLVVGWYSTAELDPLDGVRTAGRLSERMAELGWRLITGGGAEHTEREGSLGRLATLGLPVASRLDPATRVAIALSNQAPADQAPANRASAAGVATGGFAAGASFARASTVAAYQSMGATSFAREAASWVTGIGVGVEASTLLHGAVLGVPMLLSAAATAPAPDLRPDPKAVGIVAGEHVDDLVAAGLSGVLGGTGDARRSVERLLTAFSSGLLSRLSSPDGVVEVDEREHETGFATVSAKEPPVTDRVLTGRAQVPPRGAPPQAASGTETISIRFIGTTLRDFGFLTEEPVAATRSRMERIAVSDASATAAAAATSSAAAPVPGAPAPSGNPGSGSAGPDSNAVDRPAPARYVPLDPMVALRGICRSLRHGGDGRADPDELLGCRRASQIAQRYTGLVDGAALLADLSSGALPAETLALAREALLLSPHLLAWMAAEAPGSLNGPGANLPAGVVHARLGAELALRFDPSGAYLGKAAASTTIGRGDRDPVQSSVLELLRRHSLLEGVEPDLVALTSWAQPWIPTWLEWQVVVTPAADLTGWQLGPVDLEPAPGTPSVPVNPVTVAGRAHLTTAPGSHLAGAVAQWLTQEQARDRQNLGEVDDRTASRIAALGTAAAGLDLMAASFDGVRRALLGLPQSALSPRQPDGTTLPPAPVGLPALLEGGTVTLTRLRVVDAFGRTLDLDPAGTVVPERVAVASAPATMVRTPRITAPARCRVRLVGAESTDARSAADAVVDEVDASRQVNPVIGFLLPNHVDDAVQVFGSDGTPLGELLTEPTGGGVVWEPAPGRPVRADAPPGTDLTPQQRPLGLIASGMVAADALARAGRPAGAPQGPAESAVSAFLRAVDTTLWTVDPISGAGSSAVASIVGRPVAVVRATLSIDIADDLADLTLDDTGRAARAQAYADLARLGVRVRIGELTRADDGVLGWFVDDDYRAIHVVDKVVRDLALESGAGKGHFGPWGQTPVVPAGEPILHPYLDPDDGLVIHPGTPRLLTLLMLPGSSAVVTSGIVPRTVTRLQRAWFAPGLEKLSPSIRVGPVLVDPGEVRLPAVTALGQRQVLTHREGPLAWKDDAILAATQSALLPDRASVLREGWIRVDPSPAPAAGSTGSTGAGQAGSASTSSGSAG